MKKMEKILTGSDCKVLDFYRRLATILQNTHTHMYNIISKLLEKDFSYWLLQNSLTLNKEGDVIFFRGVDDVGHVVDTSTDVHGLVGSLGVWKVKDGGHVIAIDYLSYVGDPVDIEQYLLSSTVVKFDPVHLRCWYAKRQTGECRGVCCIDNCHFGSGGNQGRVCNKKGRSFK